MAVHAATKIAHITQITLVHTLGSSSFGGSSSASATLDTIA